LTFVGALTTNQLIKVLTLNPRARGLSLDSRDGSLTLTPRKRGLTLEQRQSE